MLCCSPGPPADTGALHLSVGLLEPRAGTATTKLLWLAAAGVRHQQAAVVLQQVILQLGLALLIHVLLVEGDHSLGDGLADGVDLRDVATTLDAQADVQVLQALTPDDEHRLKGLVR
uniref:Uncharacterized protein n=1 Tax=Dunaliella tertiolecta TaxID=3047 RepID=A0A7S3R7Z4_DUNTE